MVSSFVSIILPIYNQTDHVADLINEYEAALTEAGVIHELILVENGSSDTSYAACLQVAETYTETVRALHEDLPGWGRAVRRGLREARGDILCYTNSARTTAQDLMLVLRYAIANPGTVAKANRRIRESWLRRLGSLLFNLQCRTLFDLPFWDINGTPKIFARGFTHLLELMSNDDLIDAEFAAVCRRKEYPVIEVPIASTRRRGSRSTTGVASAIRLYVGAFRLYYAMASRF